MTLKKHIKRGPRPDQMAQKNSKAGSGVRSSKHVKAGKKPVSKRMDKNSSEVSRTACHADHPSNKVGGFGRTKYRKSGY